MEGNNDGRFFTEKIVFDNIKLDDELFNNIILFLKSERFYVFDAKTEEDIKFVLVKVEKHIQLSYIKFNIDEMVFKYYIKCNKKQTSVNDVDGIIRGIKDILNDENIKKTDFQIDILKKNISFLKSIIIK